MEETTGVFPNRIRMEPEATEGMRLQGCRKQANSKWLARTQDFAI